MSIIKNGQIIAGASKNILYHYNVGDIFYTSRLDTSLNGAVECNGGTYSTADYTGDGNIGSLLQTGKLPYVSLTEYNNIVNTKGSCRAFGWDGIGTTAFRVPTLTDVYIEAGTASTAGEFIDESLPNITGTVGNCIAYTSGTGAFSTVGGYSGIANANRDSQGEYNVDFNAHRSNTVYQDNAHVHPNSVRYRAMIQLFNSATDEAVAICGDVVAELATKADVSASNFNSTGKSTISGLGFPSNRYIDITLGASGTQYTAPANGYVYLAKTAGAANSYIFIYHSSYIGTEIHAASTTASLRTFLPVKKDDVFTVTYTTTGATSYFRFVYAEGEPSS